MVIDFENVNNKWYVVKDDYEGDFEDLEMVSGADDFLNYISTDGLYASIEIFDEEPTIGDYSTLNRLDHDGLGATYSVNNYENYSNNIWLCNVAHLFFGEHPEIIYFKVNE